MKFKLWISLLVIMGLVLIPVQFVDAVAFIQGTISYLDDLLDVNATSPLDNQALTWDNATSMWIAENVTGSVTNLTDVGDVNISAPTDNWIVYWNDAYSEWQARAEDTFSWGCDNLSTCYIGNLSDVNATPSDNDLLYWNNTYSEWQARAESTFSWDCSNLSICNISSIGGVNATSPSDNDIFYWNNSAGEWLSKAESIFNCTDLSACNISSLSDVNTSSLSDNDFFYWNNTASEWQNRALVATDIPNLDTAKITTGTFLMARLPTEVKTAGIIFIIDGSNTTITTGEKGHLEIPFNCTITQATLMADQDGSIVVDIWKDTYANFPPTDADNITSATPPTITTDIKVQDSTLTNWTTTITSGDILAYNVDSCANITRITLSLVVEKT